MGTAAYKTSIVQPVVTYLVLDAQLRRHRSASSPIVVTPDQVHAEIAKNVQQLYGGDESRVRDWRGIG